MIQRGEVYWVDLRPPQASQPAKRRPVLVVQADSFNSSRIGTVIAAVITSNLRLADAPGNLALARRVSKLPKDSAVNVSQLVTLDKTVLGERVSHLPPDTMAEVGSGLSLVLGL